MATEKERLQAAVGSALESSSHSASKWNGLRDALMEIFELPQEDVRCGLISRVKNITNRTQKDVAWQNPRILALVVEPNSEVSVEAAKAGVLGFAAKYARRHEDEPKLRACLLFDGATLAEVIRFHSPGSATAGATVVDLDSSLDEDDTED